MTDDRDAALTALRAALTDPQAQDAGSMLLVSFLADHFDDSDLTLAALRRAYVDLGGTNIGLMWRQYRSPVLSDPRFKDILRDLGLTDYFRASGSWNDFCRPLAGSDDFECR